MGTNCASLIAPLFLYFYYSQFMTKIQKDPLKEDLVYKLNTFRDLGNFLALNNPEFQKLAKEIYLE